MKGMSFSGKCSTLGSKHRGEALPDFQANPDLMRCHLIKASTLISPRSRPTFAASPGTYKHNYTRVPAKFAIFLLPCENTQMLTGSADVTAVIRFQVAASLDKSGHR